MYLALSSIFNELSFDWRYGFFHETIGGLRFSEDMNKQMAHYLRETDRILCELGVIQASEFIFVGRKRIN